MNEKADPLPSRPEKIDSVAGLGRGEDGGGRKENVERSARRGVREDLEATQFPLTTGVCFSSRYIDPHPPPPTRCFLPRETGLVLFLPLPQDESQPPRTHAATHVRRPRERERKRARAPRRSRILYMFNARRQTRPKVILFFSLSSSVLNFGNVSIFYVSINKQIFRAHQRGY